MKKQIVIGIGIAACVTLCASVLPRNAEVGDLPAEPVKAAATAEIEARSEETRQIFLSADTLAHEKDPVAENEPEDIKITAEKETEKPTPTQTAQQVKSTSSSAGPHMGDVRVVVRVVDGENQIYILGFDWIKDEGGGSVGTVAEDMHEYGNKIGVMGGTVGSDGDINKQVGIMGGAEPAPNNSLAQPPAELEITGDVIYIELQPPITKDNTPPAYKPNGEDRRTAKLYLKRHSIYR